MSQLSRLIEQARKTRSVNDIFKFQPATVPPLEGEPHPDILLARLEELENCLFERRSDSPLPIKNLVDELGAVAGRL